MTIPFPAALPGFFFKMLTVVACDRAFPARGQKACEIGLQSTGNPALISLPSLVVVLALAIGPGASTSPGIFRQGVPVFKPGRRGCC